MELAMQTLSSTSFTRCGIIRESKPKSQCMLDPTTYCSSDIKLQKQGRKAIIIPSALPETAASIAIAVTVVGAAASVLIRRTKTSEENEILIKVCEDCGGSGICYECKGEGFVLKKLSEERAEQARKTAKNMATRYTAGLPKKWSYCTKCSSSRSCNKCGGSGKLSY
ncbi:hypothetical protein K2173_023589 [Erythroxylum novogranatense]|uniref:DUF7895 domain-containing protein n=1 Tax=Erythroxylum novogranatense TaxID=1862640 RepID=A0AAV8TP17_9ROSI|nr:hypothetical protein K2173_023589 [Erythroxylum novogranatense]